MKAYTAVIERDRETGYYVGYVPGLPGAHSQGETLDELRDNLREAIELIMEDDRPPELSVEFVDTQQIVVA
jgi:predicted RNase H-like HicB family nuclease